jgi:hypothetical protein
VIENWNFFKIVLMFSVFRKDKPNMREGSRTSKKPDLEKYFRIRFTGN